MRATEAARTAPISEAARRAAFAVALLAGLLLLPAGLAPGGTWLWRRGLAFVGAYGAVTATGNIALAAWRPTHFEVRQQGVIASREKKQPLIDAVGTVVLVGFAIAWAIFIPIDVFALRLLPAPTLWVSAAGGLAAILGAALTPLAVWENRFAAPNVQDQTAQGQQIVESGVYGVVRHPIYLGNLLLFGGQALWLGSYAAFIGVGVMLVFTLGRILVEEKDLRARLPTYRDYARRVRGGLIPLLL